MKSFDDSCLGHFESVSHAIERFCGVHPFWLAATGYFIVTTVLFVWVLKNEGAAFLFAAGLLILVSLVNFRFTPHLIRESYRTLAQGLQNPFKIDPLIIRVRLFVGAFMLSVMIASLFSTDKAFIYLIIVSIALWLTAYLYCCDPLPPNRKKERILLFALFARMRHG